MKEDLGECTDAKPVYDVPVVSGVITRPFVLCYHRNTVL